MHDQISFLLVVVLLVLDRNVIILLAMELNQKLFSDIFLFFFRIVLYNQD